MYKVLKFGVYFSAAVLLAGCSASEHFMQDDVYNTRTPIMPPGTDLNDVTDYATFVAKKEQTEIPPEQTAYVSPRQYTDLFYRSQYVSYGYSPYAPVTGISYAGYGNYFRPSGNFYTGMFYGGSMYPYGYSSAYFGNPYGIGYGSSFYGTTSWYTPVGKPNTSKNLSSAHAGTSAGRMGSTNNGVVSYQNKMIVKPTTSGYTGVGRNTTVNSSPVISPSSSGRNSGLQARETARPVVTGRSSTSTATQRTGTSSNRTMEATPKTGSGKTFNNNNSSTRTSSPSVRSSGGSSGGSVSTPSSGGGSRSGGRR